MVHPGNLNNLVSEAYDLDHCWIRSMRITEQCSLRLFGLRQAEKCHFAVFDEIEWRRGRNYGLSLVTIGIRFKAGNETMT